MTRLYLPAFLVCALLPVLSRADEQTRPNGLIVRLTQQVQPQPERTPVELLPQGPELLRNIQPRTFDSITTDLQPSSGLFPEDKAGERTLPREETPDDVTWKPFLWAAPEIWHRPLYFDDIQLERYGQTWSPLFQPVLSGAHFFGTVPILPYKTGLDRPFEMVSTLGYYRPGSPAPCVGRRIPWQWDAALIQAGAVASGVFILP